jgi:hypothetical protein
VQRLVLGLAVVTVLFCWGSYAQDELDRARLHVGPVDLHPHLDFVASYDDNVLLKRDNRLGDFAFTTSPGLQLACGQSERNFVTLDYTASFERFLRLSSQDANNQFVKFNTQIELHQLTIGLSHIFQDIKGPNTQVGARVSSLDNVTHLDLEYRISSKTSIGVGYGQYLHDYDLAWLYDSREYTPYATLFYHMSPKSDLFCRFAYGWVSVDGGPSATYQEVDVGVRGKLTRKISGSVHVGYQHRSFSDSYGDMDGVVASADLQILLTRRTTLALGVSRSFNPSPSVMNNSYESTRVDCKLTHRFPHQKVGVWIGGGYERDDYERPVSGIDRVDDFFEVSAGVTWDTTKWMQLSAEYLFWDNDSRLTELSFRRNLAACRT